GRDPVACEDSRHTETVPLVSRPFYPSHPRLINSYSLIFPPPPPRQFRASALLRISQLFPRFAPQIIYREVSSGVSDICERLEGVVSCSHRSVRTRRPVSPSWAPAS